MSTSNEAAAMRLALEALVLNNKEWKDLADSGDSGYWFAEDQDHYKQTNEAIKALEEALAKQSDSVEQNEPDYKALWQQMCERCDELDAKLAKQEPVAEPHKGEPVAWQGRMDNESEWENLDDEKQAHWRRDSCGYAIRALYTEPQPKAEQEPLARERAIVDLIVAEHGYPKEFKKFEAALKARNNTTSQPDQDDIKE